MPSADRHATGSLACRWATSRRAQAKPSIGSRVGSCQLFRTREAFIQSPVKMDLYIMVLRIANRMTRSGSPDHHEAGVDAGIEIHRPASESALHSRPRAQPRSLPKRRSHSRHVPRPPGDSRPANSRERKGTDRSNAYYSACERLQAKATPAALTRSTPQGNARRGRSSRAWP